MNGLKVLLVAAGVAVLPGVAVACAFHAQANVAFSIPHPASIPVALAVYEGVLSGRLPRVTEAPAPLALLRANSTVRGLSEALAPNGAQLPPIALVLVEASLWGRITSESGSTRLRTHVDGPVEGDVIVLTGEPALRALLDGRISWDAAIAGGLVVVDGPAAAREQLAQFLAQRFT